jgi:arsenate reductase (thioredoxin)
MSSLSQAQVKLHESLQITIENLIKQFDTIPSERRDLLKHLTEFVETKSKTNQKIALIFICTHNSRRSHISQIWAQVAAAYYGISNVVSYSGGTEATAFNPRAVQAMEKVGFKIVKTSNVDNPIYKVSFSHDANEVIANRFVKCATKNNLVF